MSVVYVAARREGGRKNGEGDGEGLINYFREGGEQERRGIRCALAHVSAVFNILFADLPLDYLLPLHAYRKPIRERESR